MTTKIRFYPKKDVVLGQLKERLLEAEDQVADDIAALDTILASVIVRSHGDELYARQNLETAKRRRDDLEDKIELLESHDPPEVMCEIED